MFGFDDSLQETWKTVMTALRARARLRRQQAAKARSMRLQYVPAEQLAYADTLEAGVVIGRILLIGTFALYAFGVAEPKVSFDNLPFYWKLPVGDYLQAAGVGGGWNWIFLLGYGDFVNFVGIAFLAGLTLVCYARVLKIFVERKDKVFIAILILQIAVLALAASGLLDFGH